MPGIPDLVGRATVRVAASRNRPRADRAVSQPPVGGRRVSGDFVVAEGEVEQAGEAGVELFAS